MKLIILHFSLFLCFDFDFDISIGNLLDARNKIILRWKRFGRSSETIFFEPIDKSVKPTTRVQTYLSKQITSKIVNKEYFNKSVSIKDFG